MKIETNITEYVGARKQQFKILGVELLLVLVFIGSALFYANYKTLIRDFVIAVVAFERAGDPVPFEDNVYARGRILDMDMSYGMESNNLWMLDQTRLIVPYFPYEKVSTQGVYPVAVGSIPMAGDDSFHVAGRMIPNHEEGHIALLNEREFLDQRWNDQRRALEVLVHELVHVQGGNYLFGTSEELESATSIATVEVLAAMCNYDHELACQSFWLEVSGLARTSLLLQLQDIGRGYLYDSWARLFWRTAEQQVAYDKSMRYWDKSPDALYTIRSKYALVPWQTIVAKVSVNGKADTGIKYCNTYGCAILGMPFDDIAYLFQEFDWLLENK